MKKEKNDRWKDDAYHQSFDLSISDRVRHIEDWQKDAAEAIKKLAYNLGELKGTTGVRLDRLEAPLRLDEAAAEHLTETVKGLAQVPVSEIIERWKDGADAEHAKSGRQYVIVVSVPDDAFQSGDDSIENVCRSLRHAVSMLLGGRLDRECDFDGWTFRPLSEVMDS